MQSETGFPSIHQLKSYVASKSHLKLAAHAVLSADAGLLVLSVTDEALQGKMCQNSLPSGVGRSLGAKISGGRGRPWGIFFGFYKTRHILISNSANCTVLHAVILTQYRRVTDGQTDRKTGRQTDRRNCCSWYSACNASIAARCKNTAQMVWCTQLCCQWLTLAAFGCQSITYVCSQRQLLDTGRQLGPPITERVMRLWRLCF